MKHDPYHYYVYILASSIVTPITRPGKYGFVFYVGKGIGARMHIHEEHARTRWTDPKSEFIRELWEQGGFVKKRIVFSSSDEGDAYIYEAALIKKIGLHNLFNAHSTPPRWCLPLEVKENER